MNIKVKNNQDIKSEISNNNNNMINDTNNKIYKKMINDLQNKTEELEENNNKIQLLEDKYMRVCADFKNFKYRANIEKSNDIKNSNELIIKTMLQIFDHLEYVVLLNENKLNDSIFLGIKIILEQFNVILKKYGVKSFPSLGMEFDPTIHEAITQEINDSVKDNIILREYQKGYKINGKLMRAAKVVVSKNQ